MPLAHAANWAKKKRNIKPDISWSEFDEIMNNDLKDRKREGWSYVLSGVLVTAGGLIGAETNTDPSTKLIYGLSQGLGIAGIGYGTSLLTTGSSLDSFYQGLKKTNLSPEQRNQLLYDYLNLENETKQINKQIRIYSHVAFGLLNLYASSKETSEDSKKILQFFAGTNFAFALVIAF